MRKFVDQNIGELQKILKTENIALRKVITELTQEVTIQQDMLASLGARFKGTTDRLIELVEFSSMRRNLIISRLDEEEHETGDSLYNAMLFATEMSP